MKTQRIILLLLLICAPVTPTFLSAPPPLPTIKQRVHPPTKGDGAAALLRSAAVPGRSTAKLSIVPAPLRTNTFTAKLPRGLNVTNYNWTIETSQDLLTWTTLQTGTNLTYQTTATAGKAFYRWHGTRL